MSAFNSQEFTTGDFVRSGQLNQLQKNQTIIKDLLSSSQINHSFTISLLSISNTSYTEILRRLIYIPTSDFDTLQLLVISNGTVSGGSYFIKVDIGGVEFEATATATLFNQYDIFEIPADSFALSGWQTVIVYGKRVEETVQLYGLSMNLKIGGTLG